MPGAQAHSRRTVIVAAVLIAGVLAAAGALALRLVGSDNVVLTNQSRYTEGVAGTIADFQTAIAAGRLDVERAIS